MKERSLVAFTLLVQTATGAALWLVVIALFGLVSRVALPAALIEALILAAAMLSLTHLGRPQNAWRALGNLRRSWLSREILFLLLFALVWGVFTAAVWLLPEAVGRWLFLGLAGALIGLMLVYCMARLYHLPAVPAWNTMRIPANFFLTGLLLGGLSLGLILDFALPQPSPALPAIALLSAGILVGQTIPAFLRREPLSQEHLARLAALIACLSLVAASGSGNPWMHSALVLMALALVWLAEITGRVQFYSAPQQRPM